MSWTEYMLVRESTVYENKGIAKSLLSLIATLIERAQEKEEPTENEGYCYAGVLYLAESLGCSKASVEQWIAEFIKEKWLVKEKMERDKQGHDHNRYALADGAVDRLKALKRVRGAERPKNLNKVRKHTPRLTDRFGVITPERGGNDAGDPRRAYRTGSAVPNGQAQPSLTEREPAPNGQAEGVGYKSSEKSHERRQDTLLHDDKTDASLQNPTPTPKAFQIEDDDEPVKPLAPVHPALNTPDYAAPLKGVSKGASHRHFSSGKCVACGLPYAQRYSRRCGEAKAFAAAAPDADAVTYCGLCYKRPVAVGEDVCAKCLEEC